MIELAKKHLKKVLRVCGANRNCQYYPCHFDGQVCLWCYCPFYPCGDEELGEMIKRKDGTEIWSCMNCVWIHKPDTACEVLKEILKLIKDKEIDDAIKILDDKEIMMKIKKNIEKKVGKDNISKYD